VAVALLLSNQRQGEPPGILADAIDLETGEYLSIERSYDPTDAAVLAALGTVRDSGSAVQDVGQRFHEHPLIDDRLELFFRQEVDFALRNLTRSGQVRLERVAVTTGDDWAELSVFYTNVSAQKTRTASVRVTEIVT
jgi:hypothetical protein